MTPDEIVRKLFRRKKTARILKDFSFSWLSNRALLNKYNITRCNVLDCQDEPFCVLLDAHPKIPIAGLCRSHYIEFGGDGDELEINCRMVL